MSTILIQDYNNFCVLCHNTVQKYWNPLDIRENITINSVSNILLSGPVKQNVASVLEASERHRCSQHENNHPVSESFRSSRSKSNEDISSKRKDKLLHPIITIKKKETQPLETFRRKHNQCWKSTLTYFPCATEGCWLGLGPMGVKDIQNIQVPLE